MTGEEAASSLVSSIERKIQVSFEHRVYFTRGVFNPGNGLLKGVLARDSQPAKVLIVQDKTLAQTQPALSRLAEEYVSSFPEHLQLASPVLLIEGGERAKNSFSHVLEILAHVERHGLDRHSYIMGVGGGAVLDVVGLAAATAHRGMRYVRIPTTTLAQNDSGVGVKNAINAFGKKNFIGTFAPPFAVINDFELLASLPDRDKRGGYAEAVKVALIRDRIFFETLEAEAEALSRFEPRSLETMIRRCAELHMDHIASGDPFELGSARPLDFGHWAAHKLEQISDYRLRHGEAVAIGIALDTIYSRRIGMLDASSCARVLSLLEKLGFKLFAPELRCVEANNEPTILNGLEEFREHLGGALTITLLGGIGKGVEVHTVNLAAMRKSMEELIDAAC